jgi:hypothetical protein
MKKIIMPLLGILALCSVAAAGGKDENRMKAAEQAMSQRKYTEARATFEDLKDVPRFREKCHLYLAMLYNEQGQVDNAQVELREFERFVTDKTDATLLKSSETLSSEIGDHYGILDIAVFDPGEQAGIDLGYYNLVFRSEGGLSSAQENRLKSINRTLSQAQSLINWRSDGTFLKGKIRNFPVRLYDTSPMIAEVNGVPIYFRFDFQARQGLWIPSDVMESELADKPLIIDEGEEAELGATKKDNRSVFKYLMVGIAAAAVGAGVALASQ